MTTEEIQHVTPDTNSLSSIKVNLSCPQGCSRTFANSSALRLHLSQVHHHETECTTSSNTDVWYHCPEASCIYHISFGINGKHFSKLKYVKQHYLKVHATRHHGCECGQAFSTAAHLAQHRRACGLDLVCTCGRSFQALETLQTHVRRFSHAITQSTLQALRSRKNLLAESMTRSQSFAGSPPQAVIAHHIPIKYQRIDERKEENISLSSTFPTSIAPASATICSATATLNPVTPVHLRQPTHLLAAIALSELAATSIKRLPCVDVGIQTDPEHHGKRARRKSCSPAKCSEYLGVSTSSRHFGKRKRTAETQTRLTHRDSKYVRSGSHCAPSPLNMPGSNNESIPSHSYIEDCNNENGSLGGLSLQVDLPEFISTQQSTSGTQTSPRVGGITQPSLHDFTISFFDRACGEDEPGISPSLTTITSTQTSDDLDSFESSQLLIQEDEELLGVVGDSTAATRQRPPSLGHIRSSSIETQTDHDVLLSKNANTPDDVDGIILTNNETQTDPSNLLIPNVSHSYQNPGSSEGCHIHEGDSLWCTSETQTYEDFSDIEQFMRSTIHTQTPDNSHSELFPELSFTHTQTQTSLDDPPSLVTTHTQTSLNEL
ncbi:ATM interactor-like [Portunus trituberculatus]|uniref:ATM interactor-like n=1 Tax=Portunus trituberculatus TaxID=210409 RepID=UPI001E1CE33A|nr:ATM interactor-like [Portunus trituberculatus]